MQIQPLLLTAPTLLPGMSARFEVHDARVEKSSTGRQESDSVEISTEAEAQLAGELTEEQQKQVEQLKSRDREVQAHERAHAAAAGPYARGGPSFTYQKGPDGQRYAVGGEVQIDTSSIEGDPEATLRKAQIIRAAALAPAEPSSQDRAVAVKATQMEAGASKELREQQQSDREDAGPEGADIGSLLDAIV